MNIINKLNNYLIALQKQKTNKQFLDAKDIKDYFKTDSKTLLPIINFINKNFQYIQKIQPADINSIDAGFHGVVFITKNKDLVIKIEVPMGPDPQRYMRALKKIASKKDKIPFFKDVKYIEYLEKNNLLLTITRKYYPLSEHQYGEILSDMIEVCGNIVADITSITISKPKIKKYIEDTFLRASNNRRYEIFMDVKDGVLKNEYEQLINIYFTFMKYNIKISDLHEGNIMLDKDKKTLVVVDF